MPVSDRKLAANRANAKKSTGPKTEEGKKAASRNAMRHGFAAAVHVLDLPGDDPGAAAAERAMWVGHYGSDPGRAALAETACRAAQNLRRLDRAERADAAARARTAADDLMRQKEDRAIELGRRLLHDPICRTTPEVPNDPVNRAKLDAWFAEDPSTLVAELCSFAEGVDWMIDRWDHLVGLLDREGFWHYDAKFQAVRMLGRRCEEVLDDPGTQEIFLAYNAAHPSPWEIFHEVIQAGMGAVGRPQYCHRIHALEDRVGRSAEDAVRLLREVAASERARLAELKYRKLDARGLAEREEAPFRAQFAGGPEAALRLRYATAHERTLRAAVVELNKPVKRQAEEVPEPQPAPEPAAEPVVRPKVATDPAPAAPASPVAVAAVAEVAPWPFRNEPTATPRPDSSRPSAEKLRAKIKAAEERRAASGGA